MKMSMHILEGKILQVQIQQQNDEEQDQENDE